MAKEKIVGPKNLPYLVEFKKPLIFERTREVLDSVLERLGPNASLDLMSEKIMRTYAEFDSGKKFTGRFVHHDHTRKVFGAFTNIYDSSIDDSCAGLATANFSLLQDPKEFFTGINYDCNYGFLDSNPLTARLWQDVRDGVNAYFS